MNKGVLTLDKGDGDADYTLAPGHDHVWLTVDELSIFISRKNGQLKIEVLKLGAEMDKVLGVLKIGGEV